MNLHEFKNIKMNLQLEETVTLKVLYLQRNNFCILKSNVWSPWQ